MTKKGLCPYKRFLLFKPGRAIFFSHRGPIAAKPQPNFLATEGTEDTEFLIRATFGLVFNREWV